MPTTILGIRYPALTDAPNGPLGMQNLASDVDGLLGASAVSTLAFRPGSSLQVPSTTPYDTWLTLGNVTIPTWASKAEAVITVAGAFSVTSTGTYHVRLMIGSATGNQFAITTTDDTKRECLAWIDVINSGLSPGSQSVVIQGERTAGTGGYRADANSVAGVQITWKP